MAEKPLKICLASSELAPLAKTGGLADVSAALAKYFDEAGHDVRVLIPRYARIDRAGIESEPVPGLDNLALRIAGREVRYAIDVTTLPGTRTRIYLLRCPEFYGRDSIYTDDGDEYLRFVMLSRAAIEMCQQQGFAPDVFHCHDWQTSLIPLYLKTVYAWDRLFAKTKSVLTIHNIGYQGMFPAWALDQLYLRGAEQHLHQDDLKAGVINFLKTGILYADLITTVSPTYAREILGDEYGMGLNHLLRGRADALVGILNGVDYSEWDPATDPLIPMNYTADDLRGKVECKRELMRELGLRLEGNAPVIGLVSRLVGQKGIDLIEEVVPALLARRNFALAVLGSGAARYEQFFEWLQGQFRDRVCYYRGYNNELAHWIEAGADMFLMPSRYEPCGLNQMYSLRYGTVPIVRETGGLADSVAQIDPATGTGTGILFRDYDANGLAWALDTALGLYRNRALWLRIMANGMAMDFSWARQGARYIELFRQLGKPQ
ncbi:MAG: glycogen synthase GlgA [Woeseiaceae bacterium]|nr:glycogen synthase GlgA [Woeseiaceae bacterium]